MFTYSQSRRLSSGSCHILHIGGNFCTAKRHKLRNLSNRNCFLFAVCLILLLYSPPFASTEAVTPTTKVATPAHAQIINELAVLKLLILDDVYNILGLGPDWREENGVGQKERDKAIDSILSKYNRDLVPSHGLKLLSAMKMDDLPLPMETQGAADDRGIWISLKLPDKWVAIIPFKPKANLPDVKFKSGTITVNLQSMRPTFQHGTQCLLNGKPYIYRNGKWLEKYTVSK